MNKRFSTLLAAALVAGGSSFNAFGQLSSDIESGDFAFLANSASQVLSFKNTQNNPELAFLAKDNGSGFQGITGSFYSDNVFDGISAALWLIEEIKPSDPAGVPSYRFVNKKTKQVLAFELKNDTKGTTGASASTARVSAKARAIADGGNATWALTDAGVPYVVSGDSVFTLTGDFKLVSYKGKADASELNGIVSVMKLTINPVSESMTLTEKTFNQLLTDGKLYFNGGKNVSSTEKNVLTENSWKALPYATSGSAVSGQTQFFLTNGSKVKGHSNDQAATGDAAKIDKKYFLVIDTLFNDKAGKYNKLAVDTIGYEPEFNAAGALTNATDLVKATTDRMLFARRLPATAAFSATYFVGNDSIALKAVATPVKPSGTAMQWINTYSVMQAINDVKATELYTKSTENRAAIDALINGYNTWKTTGWKTLSVNAKFGDEAAEAELLTGVNGLLSSSYLDALKATSVQTAHVEASDAVFTGVDAGVLSTAEAALAIEPQTHTALEALVDAYKAWNVVTQSSTGKFADFTGSSDLISAVESEKSAQPYDGDFDAFLAMVEAADCTEAAVTGVDGALENTVGEDAVNAAKTESAYIYKETIDAAVADYESDIAAASPSEGDKVSISNAVAVKALGSLETAMITKMETVEYASVLGAPMDYFYNGNTGTALQSVNGGAIALRNLSSVDVLTVTAVYEASAPEAAGYTEPLIQQYATAPSMGGSATIDVTKVYYIKDIQKYRSGDKNKAEGLFFDESPVNTTSGYLAAGQEFNPYSQYVVEKAAGVDKGYYTIMNRATGDVYKSGLTDQLVGDSIVIAGDSIQLVAAGTEKAS